MRWIPTCAALLACGDGTVATAPGPLGQVAIPLPPGAPEVPGALDEHTATAEVCGTSEFPPATVSLTWHSFRDGENAYLVDLAVALTEPSPALEARLSDRPPMIGGVNLTPGAPWVGVAGIVVKCRRQTRSGCRSVSDDLVGLVQIAADGRVL